VTSYKRANVKGVRKIRKIFARMEKEERAVIAKAVKRAAVKIQVDATALAIAQDIRLTGDMINSIEHKITHSRETGEPTGTHAIIGPSAKHAVAKNPFDTSTKARMNTYKNPATRVKAKAAQWNLMKAWWAEFGTEGPIEQDPQPFMNPAWDKNANMLRIEVQTSVRKVLMKLSRGIRD